MGTRKEYQLHRPRFEIQGFFVSPESVGREFHKALAFLICRMHHNQHFSRGEPVEPCKECRTLVAPLVKPLARMLLATGLHGRKPAEKLDGYAAIGEGIEKLYREAQLPYE